MVRIPWNFKTKIAPAPPRFLRLGGGFYLLIYCNIVLKVNVLSLWWSGVQAGIWNRDIGICLTLFWPLLSIVYQLFQEKSHMGGGTFPHAARLVMIVLITVVTVAERTSGSFLVEKIEHDIWKRLPPCKIPPLFRILELNKLHIFGGKWYIFNALLTINKCYTL